MAIVFFGADWCGHCKSFKPEYKTMKNDHTNTTVKSGHTLKFYTHFDTTTSEFRERFQIRAFPTIIAVKDSKYWVFEGTRNTETILKWAEDLESSGKGKKYPTKPWFFQFFIDGVKQEYKNNKQ